MTIAKDRTTPAPEGVGTVIPLDSIKRTPFQLDGEAPPTLDIRESLFQLEAEGELIVQRVPEPYVEVTTRYGRTKKIPESLTWHHKSCGQCGHIPGYSTSIFWLNRQAHPQARYLSVVRDERLSWFGDLVVPVWSQDMNQVYALRGRALTIPTSGGHSITAEDGELLVRLLRRLRLS